jgi:tetratricopeptide (TPR) repeat protein
VSIASLPSSHPNFIGRENELTVINRAWNDHATNILSIIGWGGSGKSALVNRWLDLIAANNYRDADAVFGWSFYNQGSTEEHQESSELFMQQAFHFFVGEADTSGSPFERGVRLARQIGRGRSILILDGVETLQYPAGPNHGALKDPALRSLLRELQATNEGLCILTSRVPVTDLEAQENGKTLVHHLERLSRDDGAELLRQLGVQGEHEELCRACDEFHGHALTLSLLGRYLCDALGGDVSRRHEARIFDDGGEAKRVLASYHRWLAEHGCESHILILCLVGLVDRPVDARLLNALRSPPIPGVTENLRLGESEFNRCVSELRRANLLFDAKSFDHATLDSHPVIRAYFGSILQTQNPEAWRAGHERLYRYYADSAPELPETLPQMMPLYSAVAHGCAAGHHDEVFQHIYWKRILRGSQFFSVKKLGALGADTAALSNFFAGSWARPIGELSEKSRSRLLDQAGEGLHALGRLAEAWDPMYLLFQDSVAEKNSRFAVKSAITLSELSLSMGDIRRAQKYGNESIIFADRRTSTFHRQVARSTLADALHQAGDLNEAGRLFSEAEEIVRQSRPERPQLSSMQGYAYCDLLLSQEQLAEVEARANRIVEWARTDSSLLAEALGRLALARVRRQAFASGIIKDLSTAEIEESLSLMRQAGAVFRLPHALVERATVRRLQHDFVAAKAALNEALWVAGSSGMSLQAADAHIEFAQLHFEQGEADTARESLCQAQSIMEQTGYGRRRSDIDRLCNLIR